LITSVQPINPQHAASHIPPHQQVADERCCLERLILTSADQNITQCAAVNSDSHRTRIVLPALRLTHIKTTITDLYCRLTVISLQPFKKWAISREASGLAKKKHITKNPTGAGCIP